MKHQTFYISHFKTKIFGQYWKPSTAQAVVVIVHGMGEHSSRYASYVIPQLCLNKFGVLNFDNYGHGKSEGKRGDAPSYDTLMDLITHMIDKAKMIFGKIPVVLYGHSMGGNLVLNYTLKKPEKINAAVLTSPFLSLSISPPLWKMVMGRILQFIAPSFTLPTGLDVSALSKDREEIENYRSDSLIHDKISPNFSFPLLKAGKWAMQHASSLKRPVLLIHGMEDRITDPQSSIDFSLKSTFVTLNTFENGYHELHNDIEKEELLEIVVHWIRKNIGKV